MNLAGIYYDLAGTNLRLGNNEIYCYGCLVKIKEERAREKLSARYEARFSDVSEFWGEINV